MQYRGLFIGLTTIDIQYFVETFPGSNRKVKTATPDILVGGPATNAAVAFAHLNGRAFLASAAGRNSFSCCVFLCFACQRMGQKQISYESLIFQNQALKDGKTKSLREQHPTNCSS